MGKRLKDPREKILQRSVGFPMRVHQFLAEQEEFQIDAFCRKIIDDQIRQIDKTFLSNKELNLMKLAEVEQ